MALNFLNDGYFAGKVGIGTDAPGSNLDIKSAMGTSGEFSAAQLRLDSSDTVDTTGFQGIRFATSTAVNYGWTIGANRSSNGRGSFRFFEHSNSLVGTERFTLEQDGNVGIGKPTPGYKLDVAGSIKASVQGRFASGSAATPSYSFDADSDSGMFRATTNALGFSTAGTERMRINSSGNVGIGTTSPGSTLTISSNIGGDGSWNKSGILIENTSTTTGEPTLAFRNAGGAGTGSNYWHTGLNQSNVYKIAYGTSFTDGNTKFELSTGGALKLNAYDSTNNTGTPTYILGTDASGNVVKVLGGNIPIAAPAAPSTVTSTIVGETIEIEFNQSSTSNIDYYQVWSSDDGGDYGIIGQIAPVDFSSTMTVVDTTFVTGGTMSYRVYAVKTGIYSSAATTSKSYTVSALSVTAMTVVNLNTAYYIQYEKPVSRFIDHIEIYMDSQTTLAALNRNNASIVYSGQNASYMRNVNTSNNFHQFWVEVVTT